MFLDAEQDGNLYRHLQRRHKRRRRQKRYGASRRFIPGRVGIEQRPEAVAERSRFGDWEADLILGRRGAGAIATYIERKSRYPMADVLPDKKAESFNAAAISQYQAIPATIRQTLTLDNGKEFSRFKDLEAATGLKVFFADAYSAWQRGANENINGLLRYYFPKKMSFKRLTETALAKAVHRINHRPRKCLDTGHPMRSSTRPWVLHLQIESAKQILFWSCCLQFHYYYRTDKFSGALCRVRWNDLLCCL